MQSGIYMKSDPAGDIKYLQVKDINPGSKPDYSRITTVEDRGIGDQYWLRKNDLLFAAKGASNYCFLYALLQYNLKLSSLNVLMYLGSTESIKLFLEHTDCMGIVSIRSVHKELVADTLRVVEIKGMPMQREFNFVQLQGQEGGLSQVFMRFAGHHSKSL